VEVERESSESTSRRGGGSGDKSERTKVRAATVMGLSTGVWVSARGGYDAGSMRGCKDAGWLIGQDGR